MPGGDAGNGTAFQIQRAGAGGAKQRALFGGAGNDAVASKHLAMHRTEQGGGGKAVPRIVQPGGNDNRAGAQSGV